jgi:hypothetical protein
MPRAAALAALLASLLLTVSDGRAADACADGPEAATGHVGAGHLPDGTGRPEVTLADNATAFTVVLDGVVMPARAGDDARAAFAATMADIEGATATLVASDKAPDRHGRRHGVLRLAAGDSLGERLLAAGAGLADVSFPSCASRFLAAEATARAEKRGIWRQSRIWTDLNAAAAGLPDFVLGRGRVASVGRSGRTTYINFGRDFSTDATLRLGDKVASALVAAGRPPESFAGRRVEVRGWASARNGLDLKIDEPLALRLADGKTD